MNYKMSESGIKATFAQRFKSWCACPWTLALFALLVAGAWIRFKGLTFQSLWLDELFSVGKSHPDLGLWEVIEQFRSGEDPHPPLYFTLLHFWFRLFGYTEYSARAFSAACGVFGMFALYFLGRETAGRRCGIIAVAVLLLNAFHVQFSQEVRAYVLMFAWASLSYAFFVRSLKMLKPRDLLLYAIITTLMIYTHYYGLFVLVSQAAFVVICAVFRLRGSKTRAVFLHFVIAGVLICLLYLPWLHVILRNMDRKEFWASAQDSSFFIRLFQRFFGEDPVLVWAAGVLILFAIIYTLAARILKRDCIRDDGIDLPLMIPMLLCWIFFCLFLPFYRSLTDVPMLVFRYEIIILPAVVVLVAMGVRLLRLRIVIMLVIAGIVAVSYDNLFHTRAFFTEIRKEQFREASRFVLAKTRQEYADRSIMIFSNVSGFYNVYFELLGSGRRARQLPEGDQLAAMLKRRQDLDVGVWVMTGHYKLSPDVPRLLEACGFEQAEAKALKGAAAVLYLK